MRSIGKQFTRKMLTAVACDQSVQLKVARCCCWNFSVFFKICFCFVLLHNKTLNVWSLGEQWILFPSNLNLNIEILGKQNSLLSWTSHYVLNVSHLAPWAGKMSQILHCDWLRVGKVELYYMATIVRALWLAAERALFSCSDRVLWNFFSPRRLFWVE